MTSTNARVILKIFNNCYTSYLEPLFGTKFCLNFKITRNKLSLKKQTNYLKKKTNLVFQIDNIN